MTPAERLCEPLFRYFFPKAERTGYIRPEHYEPLATIVLDALCPKGERVVLDRTGDTDRLVRQREVDIHGVHHDDIWLQPVDGDGDIDGTDHLWVDIKDGPDE